MNWSDGWHREIYSLPEPLQQRLNSYALAASAAGVGMLALAAPAEAKIVYIPTHHIIKKGVSYKLDLNRDGITDFTIQDTFITGTDAYIAKLSATPAVGHGVEGFTTSFNPFAFALKRGSPIGPRQYFPGAVMVYAGSSGSARGSWVNIKDRYLGLRFKIHGKAHYGWARLNVQVQAFSITATLTGYAYETSPNKAIIAGRTHGKSGIPAQSQTLGALAAGSPPLSSRREK